MANEIAFYVHHQLTIRSKLDAYKAYQKLSTVWYQGKQCYSKELFVNLDIFQYNVNSVDKDF